MIKKQYLIAIFIILVLSFSLGYYIGHSTSSSIPEIDEQNIYELLERER